MNPKNYFFKFNTRKTISFLVLAIFAFSMVLPAIAKAQELRFNCMSGDQETLRLKNNTQATADWSDPVAANAGDEIRFLVYYHCGWDDPAWPTEKAQGTSIRITFPTSSQSQITATARLWATNVGAVTDSGTINVSSAQKLVFGNTAEWYQYNVKQDISVTVGEGYTQANIGDIACDCTECYNNAGFVIFRASLSETYPSPPNLTISKTVRNVTDNTGFGESVSADPLDEIEFKILITSTGNTAAQNVVIKDILPWQITYQGNLKIDGIYSSADILTGVNLGTISPGQSKTITFRSQVVSAENFPYGTTSLVNSGQTWADSVSQRTDTATVNVHRSPPPPSSPGLSIDKLAKNITDNTIWLNSISADPLDRIEFRIQVTSIGDATAYNVILRDILPDKISYQGNLKIDGVSSGGDILGGFNLGSLAQGLSKTITFEGKIASENNFAQGTTTLVNSSSVRADGLGEVYDTANINVVKSGVSYVDLSAEKEVKNLTKDHTVWYQSWITAKPDHEIAFRIKVSSTGTNRADDVIVKDVLPGHISYTGNLKIDGVSSSKDILSGMNIGDLEPGESKEITFEAKVASEANFGYGITELVNTVLVYNNETAASDAVTVKVSKTKVAGATDIPTGVLSSAKISLFITILLVLGFSYLLLAKSYFSQKINVGGFDEIILDFKEKVKDLFLGVNLSPEERSEKKLSKLIAEIKKQEGLE